MRPIILGSSSPYRKELLERLRLPFYVEAPEIDETPQPDEPIEDYVSRLSHEKAAEVGQHHEDALIISSDQCATLDGKLLGKPGSYDQARRQLTEISGREVVFCTGLCLLETRTNTTHYREARHTVGYRVLDAATIDAYLIQEEPYNCAVAFRSEGLGIALTRYVRGDDPSALIGLPLIHLVELLHKVGVAVPSN